MKKRLFALALAMALTGCAAPAAPTDPTQPPVTEPTAAEYGTGLGQMLQDFTVTTVEGEQVTVSQVLQEKKLLVLNFWFADCPWCVREFPALELAYSRYKDEVEVIALTPYDDKDTASAFADRHSLSFPVGTCLASFPRYFGVTGYPTSIFIDREGRISLIHSGAITTPETFYAIFDAYTAEDYTHATYYRIDELLG